MKEAWNSQQNGVVAIAQGAMGGLDITGSGAKLLGSGLDALPVVGGDVRGEGASAGAMVAATERDIALIDERGEDATEETELKRG